MSKRPDRPAGTAAARASAGMPGEFRRWLACCPDRGAILRARLPGRAGPVRVRVRGHRGGAAVGDCAIG